MKHTFRTTSVAALAAGALLLTGCAGGGGDTSSGPVTLEYWTWAPNVQEMADVWNADHPDIQVKVTEAAGADDMIAKLLAAERAGDGPDMAQAEFQKLPNLVVSDVAADISQYADTFSSDFSEGAMSLVTVGDGVFGVPQDIGPMIFVYRADLFEPVRSDPTHDVGPISPPSPSRSRRSLRTRSSAVTRMTRRPSPRTRRSRSAPSGGRPMVSPGPSKSTARHRSESRRSGRTSLGRAAPSTRRTSSPPSGTR